MKKTGLFLLIMMFVSGIAFAKGLEVNQKAGEYDVRVVIDKNPPVVGTNMVTLNIRDKAGKQITDAKVRIDYSMPAMPGMPPMNYKTDAVLEGNEYRAAINLSMAGPWNIVVKIKTGEKVSTVKFNIDAQ
jgi:hypothetical protein